MKTDSRPHLWAADFLRVSAIGLVAWYHIWQLSWLNPSFSVGSVYVNLQQLVRNGYMMVDVLLVLSGFLLALPCCTSDKPFCTGEFYRKRFFRIVPSYVLIIALTLAFQILPQGLYASPKECILDLLAHLTFTHNLFYNTYFFTPLTGVLWTLAVEVQFYVLFPFIAKLYRKHPLGVCLGLSVIAWLFRGIMQNFTGLSMYVNQLPAMLDVFAAGMAAAWVCSRVKDRTLSAPVKAVLGILTALSYLLLLQIMYVQTISDSDAVHLGQFLYRLPVAVCAAVFLLCGSLLSARTGKILGNPVTRFLAGITYNFYLWHQFIALRLKELHIPAYTAEQPNVAAEQPWQIQYTLLCFGVTLVWAILLTYCFERPMTRLGRKKLPPS